MICIAVTQKEERGYGRENRTGADAEVLGMTGSPGGSRNETKDASETAVQSQSP